VIRQATLNLVQKPKNTILGVLAYASIAAACDDTPRLLEYGPSAVELITRRIVHLARAVPAYAQLIDFLPPGDPNPAAVLVVEFAGDSPEELRDRVKVLGPSAYVAETRAAQARIWKVRKVGLGLLMSKPGNAQPIPFIEDVAVPVEKLGDFVRAVDQICAAQNVEPAYYAHASAGCLHIRPILDLRSAGHIRAMREIATAAIAIGLEYGGAVSGEHGDGLARSEWLEMAYGPEVMQAHRILKGAADPHNLFNPGKIIDAPPMDQNLRFGAGYRSQGWQPVFSFDRQVSLENAIEMCNGAGVCRKDGGVMCPSFQATREELHSTRGRANLLRELIRGEGQVAGPDRQPPTANRQPISPEDVFPALELCLACKGCKSECPSAVDMAKLKYEFLEHYHHTHRRKWRDYLFGYFGTLAKLGAPVGKLVNWGTGNPAIWNLAARVFKLAPERKFPVFISQKGLKSLNGRASQTSKATETLPSVLFLVDDFTKHFHPEAGEAALQMLPAAGYQAKIIPVNGAGRTLISKGFLTAAKRHAQKLIAAISAIDPTGQLPIVGVEPSEIYTLSDEYPDFFPADAHVAAIAKRAWMIDEFLLRPDRNGQFPLNKLASTLNRQRPSVLLHGHCYQKARPPADDGLPTGVDATVAILETAGYAVEVIEKYNYNCRSVKVAVQTPCSMQHGLKLTGRIEDVLQAAGFTIIPVKDGHLCCGSAGSYSLLQPRLADELLRRKVRALESGDPDVIVTANIGCQMHLGNGSDIPVMHWVELMADHLVD